ncbi:hypothetical protein MJN51_35850, partial [Salmonella enterica subsp. enterica serovar Kentucky]|nr:hypothetical protein [Salmonella enterica subsp. enterica serovar Kentucky]
AKLDVLVTPLVAFDEDGQRLGMGGGFYDRTLQNWQQHKIQPVVPNQLELKKRLINKECI